MRNDTRLKSRFEAIFEKFGKDFTGVGDEIDLATGKVVVNNGHLLTMKNEQDIMGQGNGEDELSADFPNPKQSNGIPKLRPVNFDEKYSDTLINNATGQRCSENDDTDSLMGDVLENEDSFTGTSVVNALKMDIGINGPQNLENEASPAIGLLEQLIRLAPHLEDISRATFQHASYPLSSSKDPIDLTVDPHWRVPTLPQQGKQFNVEEPLKTPEDVSESQSRSSSPPGESIWALEKICPARKKNPRKLRTAVLSTEARNPGRINRSSHISVPLVVAKTLSNMSSKGIGLQISTRESAATPENIDLSEKQKDQNESLNETDNDSLRHSLPRNTFRSRKRVQHPLVSQPADDSKSPSKANAGPFVKQVAEKKTRSSTAADRRRTLEANQTLDRSIDETTHCQPSHNPPNTMSAGVCVTRKRKRDNYATFVHEPTLTVEHSATKLVESNASFTHPSISQSKRPRKCRKAPTIGVGGPEQALETEKQDIPPFHDKKNTMTASGLKQSIEHDDQIGEKALHQDTVLSELVSINTPELSKDIPNPMAREGTALRTRAYSIRDSSRLKVIQQEQPGEAKVSSPIVKIPQKNGGNSSSKRPAKSMAMKTAAKHLNPSTSRCNASKQQNEFSWSPPQSPGTHISPRQPKRSFTRLRKNFGSPPSRISASLQESSSDDELSRSVPHFPTPRSVKSMKL